MTDYGDQLGLFAPATTGDDPAWREKFRVSCDGLASPCKDAAALRIYAFGPRANRRNERDPGKWVDLGVSRAACLAHLEACTDLVRIRLAMNDEPTYQLVWSHIPLAPDLVIDGSPVGWHVVETTYPTGTPA